MKHGDHRERTRERSGRARLLPSRGCWVGVEYEYEYRCAEYEYDCLSPKTGHRKLNTGSP